MEKSGCCIYCNDGIATHGYKRRIAADKRQTIVGRGAWRIGRRRIAVAAAATAALTAAVAGRAEFVRQRIAVDICGAMVEIQGKIIADKSRWVIFKNRTAVMKRQRGRRYFYH